MFLSIAKETVEMNVTIVEYNKKHPLKNAIFTIHTKPYSFRRKVFLSLMNHQTLHMNQQKSCHLEETLTAREKRGKGNTVPSP